MHSISDLDPAIKSILTSFDDFIFLLSIEGEIVFINDATIAALGYQPEEMLGMNVLEVHPPDRRVEAATIVDQMLKGTEKFCPVPLLAKSGSLIPVETRVSMIQLKGVDYLLGVSRDTSGWIRDRENLARSRQQLELILDATDDGFWDWNVKSGQVEFGFKWADMLGYTLDEVEPNVGFWEKLIHPDDKLMVFDAIESHLSGTTDQYRTEHRVLHKNGEWVWILDRGKIVERDQNNHPLRMVGTHSDITSRKMVEEQLRYRESFELFINEIATNLITTPYNQIDEHIEGFLQKTGEFIGVDRSYIFLYDPATKTMSNTHEWCKSGIEPQKDILQQLPFETFSWVVERMLSKKTINAHDIALLPDEAAAERAILQEQDIKSVLITPLISLDSIIGFIGFDAASEYRQWNSDTELLLQNASIMITNALQRKEYETKLFKYRNHLESLIQERTADLEASNRILNHSFGLLARQNQELLKFKTIADQVNYAILIITDDGAINYSNRKTCESFGCPASSLSGIHFFDNFVDKESKDYSKLVNAFSLHQEVASLEITIIKSDGRKFPALTNVSAIQDKESGFQFFVVSITDLTQRRKEEKELRQSEKLRSLGTLAGGVAHDFNNILQIVQVYTELLALSLSDRQQFGEHQEEIIKACQRGKSLVNNILTFSRQEPDEMAPYDFYFLISEIVKSSKPIYPSSIEIVHEIGPCGTVLCDPVQIQQIVFNLFNNSVDAMNGKGTIKVTAGIPDEPEEEAGMMVMEVSDTGSGMTRETLSRAFDPFFTTKGVGEGTGLGLSTVMGIVKKHSGKIRIISAPGQGTVVRISLPVLINQ